MQDASDPRILFGFQPREISSLFNLPVIAEHASEARFLWSQRRSAVRAPHYTLEQLARLDERLLAHLAGLQVAGAAGWRAALDALGTGEPGAVFTAGYVAFSRRDLDGMRHTLALAQADDQYSAALLDALAWLPLDQIDWSVQRLLISQTTQHRWLACAALSAHRAHHAATLEKLVSDADPMVRARALRAVGENKLTQFQSALSGALRDDDVSCRFWAAWSLALMGNTSAARSAFDAGYLRPELTRDAIEVAMRCAEPAWSRDTIRVLAADSATRREAIQAVAAFGDPITLPWVIELCADAQHAATAGAALSTITGADLELLDLDTDRPESAPEGHEDDENLPWPDAARINTWWLAQSNRFASGQRYLGGEPISSAGAVRVLRSGYQRQRIAAAIELGRIEETRPLFAVDARADWQVARFAV